MGVLGQDDTQTSPEHSPRIAMGETIEETDSGMARRRINPFLIGAQGQPISHDMADDFQDGRDHVTCDCGAGSVLTQAAPDLLHHVNHHDETEGGSWDQPLRDIVLNRLYDEITYRNVVTYLEDLFEESCTELKFCTRPTISRMVRMPSHSHLGATFVPEVLRLLYSLGYEYEGVDRVEAMDHVTLFVNGGIPMLRISNMCQLMRCMGCLSLVEARFLLQMERQKAGTILELIEEAGHSHMDGHYQTTLKQLWDQGDAELLETIGFSKRRIHYGKSTFKHMNSDKCREKASAIARVIKVFHRPANTRV